MSHLHFPDGVLPVWLWLSGLIALAVLLLIALILIKRKKYLKQTPLVGVMAALMIVGMTIEIVPIAYHVNLAVPAGILLGPVLGGIAAFISNLFLALLGHGGITMVGLNTLLTFTELLVGWLFFTQLLSTIKNIPTRAFISTFIALALSGLLSLGLVSIAAPDLADLHDHEDEGGIFNLELFTTHEGEGAEEIALELIGTDTITNVESVHEDDTHEKMYDSDHEAELVDHNHEEGLTRFVITSLSLGVVGWLLESALVALLIGYIAKIRPSLIPKSQGAANEKK